jgi:hypothetical protein
MKTAAKHRQQARDARFLQETTGAAYTTCLRKVQDMIETVGVPGLCDYLDRAEKVNVVGTAERPLCLGCFAPLLAGHKC